MPSSLSNWIRFLAWCALLGAAVLLTARLVGRVQANTARVAS